MRAMAIAYVLVALAAVSGCDVPRGAAWTAYEGIELGKPMAEQRLPRDILRTVEYRSFRRGSPGADADRGSFRVLSLTRARDSEGFGTGDSEGFLAILAGPDRKVIAKYYYRTKEAFPLPAVHEDRDSQSMEFEVPAAWFREPPEGWDGTQALRRASELRGGFARAYGLAGDGPPAAETSPAPAPKAGEEPLPLLTSALLADSRATEAGERGVRHVGGYFIAVSEAFRVALRDQGLDTLVRQGLFELPRCRGAFRGATRPDHEWHKTWRWAHIGRARSQVTHLNGRNVRVSHTRDEVWCALDPLLWICLLLGPPSDRAGRAED